MDTDPELLALELLREGGAEGPPRRLTTSIDWFLYRALSFHNSERGTDRAQDGAAAKCPSRLHPSPLPRCRAQPTGRCEGESPALRPPTSCNSAQTRAAATEQDFQGLRSPFHPSFLSALVSFKHALSQRESSHERKKMRLRQHVWSAPLCSPRVLPLRAWVPALPGAAGGGPGEALPSPLLRAEAAGQDQG